jgi:hypothetical protein
MNVVPTNQALRPMDTAARILAPLLGKLGQNIKSMENDIQIKQAYERLEVEDLDKLVVLYTMLPFLIQNEESGKLGRRRARRKNKTKESITA